MITRKWLALWYKNRFLMIIQWQARCRRHLSNKRLRPLLKADQDAAVRCQKAVRMFLAKSYAYWKRLDVATVRIQCMWRGCVARARCDKIWLDKQVTFMQKGARRMMARGKFVEEKREMDEAAAMIERCWRGFWGRRMKVSSVRASGANIAPSKLIAVAVAFLVARRRTSSCTRGRRIRGRTRFGCSSRRSNLCATT